MDWRTKIMIPKFIKRLYLKRLTSDEKIWLGCVRLGRNVWNDKQYPPMTMKQFKKMCERDRLY